VVLTNMRNPRSFNCLFFVNGMGSCLRHYATRWKVASLVTMALGSTQTLTEMSTRNAPGSEVRPARKAVSEVIVRKTWKPRRLTNPWTSMACYRDSFAFFLQSLSSEDSSSLRPMNPSVD
jgi:hypothetical protein